tara:strand:- start:1013 stop:1258 length:246 start_codon:yes stop_codon:yes gene_type:complete
MCFRVILIFSLISLSFCIYQVGDQISREDQAQRFNVCYGAEHHLIEEDSNGDYTLSLGDYNGNTNGNCNFNVMMIDMAASW